MIPLFITRVRSHRCKDTTHTLCSVVFKNAWNLHDESHGVIYPAVYSYTAAYFQFTIILSLFTTYSPLPGLVRLLLLLLLRNMSDQLYSVQFPRNLEIIFLMTFLTLNKMLYITCSIYFATFKRILVTHRYFTGWYTSSKHTEKFISSHLILLSHHLRNLCIQCPLDDQNPVVCLKDSMCQ